MIKSLLWFLQLKFPSTVCVPGRPMWRQIIHVFSSSRGKKDEEIYYHFSDCNYGLHWCEGPNGKLPKNKFPEHVMELTLAKILEVLISVLHHHSKANIPIFKNIVSLNISFSLKVKRSLWGDSDQECASQMPEDLFPWYWGLNSQVNQGLLTLSYTHNPFYLEAQSC